MVVSGLLLGSIAMAQKITTQGKEFYVAFYKNYNPSIDTTELFLTSSVNTSGTISNPNTGYSVPFTITAGNITIVTVPLGEAYNENQETASNLGLIVTSKDTISLYALCNEINSSDATNVIPKNSLGEYYSVASYPTDNNSCFLIEATEDSTKITIVPSSITTNFDQPGIPINILLNKGQTYLVTSLGGDMSGSTVSVTNGCKPIAVFAGSELSDVPLGYAAGDQLYEQLFPVNTFGKQFITIKLKGRNTNRVRVYAAFDNTAVNINGVLSATLNTGKFYEFETNNIPDYITTSNPVQVMLFGVGEDYDQTRGPANSGDPTMITMRPIEQALSNAVFLSPQIGVIAYHHASITCKTADAGKTILDGQNIGSLFTVVPGNVLYSTASVDLKAGPHQITNSGGFLAYAYGFGDYQGYGYSAGSGVDNIGVYFTCDSVASIDDPTLSVCRGLDTFNIVTADSVVLYSWDFGDGSPKVTTKGNVLSQVHNYPNVGNYTVSLTAFLSASAVNCAQSNTTTTQLTLNVDSVLVPSVKITSLPQNPVCNNTPATFIATAQNGGARPGYQWQVNGKNAGSDSSNFSYTPQSGDIVTCKLSSSFACANPLTASDTLKVDVTQAQVVSVNITTPHQALCTDTLATFTAKSVNGGINPEYVWVINGYSQNINSPSFSYIPGNGDMISCILLSSNTCVTKAADTSNIITMSVSSSLPPSVTIFTAQNPICLGLQDTYNATPYNTGNNVKYQWQVNGNNVGTDSAGFAYIPAKNDIITCKLTGQDACSNDTISVVSNEIQMLFTLLTPQISIALQQNPVCAGTPDTFTATSLNGGTQPEYQWKVNGNNTGSNSDTLTTAALANNDVISCEMTSSLTCAATPTVLSNNLSVQVMPLVTPSVSITASENPVCIDTLVNFATAATNAGTAPQYTWQLNGSSVGNNSAYSSSHLADGDMISCILTSNAACATTPVAQSNIISMKVNPTVITSVDISTPDNPVCSGINATFTASGVNGGNDPAYQWQVNGSPAGTNNNIYSTNTLKDGDAVTCRLTSSLSCTAPVLSPAVPMHIYASPTVVFDPADTVIAYGTSFQLRPVLTGVIAKYVWLPGTGLDDTSIANPIGRPDKTISYNLAVTTVDGCKADGGIVVTVFRPLQMPSAFTPNGDRKNDIFRIPPLYSLTLHNFSIYNRWGQLLFTSSNINDGWDGTINGQPQASGTYIYVIKYDNLLTKKTEIVKGTVVLIR